MQVTLQEKWANLLGVLEMKKRAFLDQVLAEHPRPAVIYSLESYKTIRALIIEDVSIWVGLPYLERDKPTRGAVSRLAHIVGEFSPTLDDVLLSYRYDRTSGAIRLPELLAGNRYALTREALLSKQQELIEKYEPREGYKPCTYCGTQRPEQEMVDHTVIARQYPNMRKTSRYCNKTCGTHDQMAHEG